MKKEEFSAEMLFLFNKNSDNWLTGRKSEDDENIDINVYIEITDNI